ncbi:MAG: L-glyceraldehyde 3-phosphate reductase [Bacteroidales bacterium]|nr:L-glyceraldehyde 3-phosphate reductase [Bacteroidales bacterium]MCF8403554.1 L-glyceraldehyde 3-phosphate reductase [Bacteroidales bacterium]
MTYTPSESRYNTMSYNRCGNSGLKLPAISLGLWHNWGDKDNFEKGRMMLRKAFDLGITHFDLANNYGPPYGAAERNFGKILKLDFSNHRDELIISSKAGWDMWPGPYGNYGSRKYLIASLDQSLERMGLDYVDIFYHHRPDPATPLEETMGALDHIVKSSKALYVGISQYNAEDTTQAAKILREMGTPLLIHQPRYNMFDRWIEPDLLKVLAKEGVGSIVFSPLAQGLLTDRYLKGLPADSRAVKDGRFLNPKHITDNKLNVIRQLNTIAKSRNQTLAQMATAWVLRMPEVTSALIGASNVGQIEEIVEALNNTSFAGEELEAIDRVLMK